MKTCIKGLNISGIAACLSGSLPNKDVHIADNTITTADLCERAANHLLKEMDIDKNCIDALIFISTSPDYRAPATSCIMQDRLGLSIDVLAFDIKQSCAAYIYGLYQAAMLIDSGGCTRVLVCTGGMESGFAKNNDESVQALMGNAGTATIIEKGHDTFCFNIKTDGPGYKDIHTALDRQCYFNDEISGTENLCSDGNINVIQMKMDFFANEIPVLVEETLLQAGWQKSEVETFAFHQTDTLKRSRMADVLGISLDSITVALDEKTNTVAIPLSLCLDGEKLREQNRLNKVFAFGFGADLSWGAVTINLNNATIFEPIEY